MDRNLGRDLGALVAGINDFGGTQRADRIFSGAMVVAVTCRLFMESAAEETRNEF